MLPGRVRFGEGQESPLAIRILGTLFRSGASSCGQLGGAVRAPLCRDRNWHTAVGTILRGWSCRWCGLLKLAFILAIVEFLDGDAHRVHYLRRPFQREPYFGVTSVNYDFGELLARAEVPGP